MNDQKTAPINQETKEEKLKQFTPQEKSEKDKESTTPSQKQTTKGTSRFGSFFQRLKRKSKIQKQDDSQPKKKWYTTKKATFGFVFLIVMLLISAVVGGVGAYTYSVVQELQTQSQEVITHLNATKDMLKSQNLPAVEAELTQVESQVNTMEQTYKKLSFYKGIPFASKYYNDGEHGFKAAKAGLSAGQKTVAAIVPHADLLGFSGEGSFEGGTAENRIQLLLETLDKITPVIDDITADLETMDTEIGYIDPLDYPEELMGKKIRENVVEVHNLSDGALKTLTDFRPVLEVLPEIAGNNERKKYLVIFQNDNEIRPTGGFMTAYAVMFIEKGKVYPEKSDDIYELDKKWNKKIPIPEVLGKYLVTEKYWNLRDMNISPDFKVSMDIFYEHYQTVPGEPDDVDGIVAIDTNLLTDLVEILGPVEVPGYGTFSAEIDERCDCPQIIYVMSEIVDRPTPYIRENRKGIIAPMMQSILQKTYTAPKELWGPLFTKIWENVEEKHVQAYLFTEGHQGAVEAVNAGGRVYPPTEDADYFMLVDTNLGGAKSNLFIDQAVHHTVSAPQNGVVEHRVELEYKNPHKPDNCNLEAGELCLNGTFQDWVRVYLPKDATLVEALGFDEGTIDEKEDLDLHVIEGEFKLHPLSNAKIVITYTVPYNDAETYRLDLQKQAGTDNFEHTFDVNGSEEKIILNKDQRVEIGF